MPDNQATNASRAHPAGDGTPPLPVGVIGCGRMGRLHARVYSEMPQVRLVGVCDINAEAAESTAQQYGCRAFTNINELLEALNGHGREEGTEARRHEGTKGNAAANPQSAIRNPQSSSLSTQHSAPSTFSAPAAVTIAVPTNFHPEAAEACLDRGIACLVEKPLAKDVADARRIADAARGAAERFGGLTVQVGHIERFNPAIRAMSRLGIEPRFIEVTRISPMTFRSIDVGVVLDMMIHDIDIVLRLAGCKVSRIDATGVSVIGEVEDICNARLTFENGCVANVTASRLALKTERKLRVFSPDAYVSIDYQKRYGMVARRSGNVDAIRNAVSRIRSGEVKDLSELNFAEIVHIEELQIDDIEPLRAELDAFVHSVRNGTRPEVSVEDGLAAVETATRIVEAIAGQSLG